MPLYQSLNVAALSLLKNSSFFGPLVWQCACMLQLRGSWSCADNLSSNSDASVG